MISRFFKALAGFLRRHSRKFLYVLIGCAVVISAWLLIVDVFIENADPHAAAPENTEWVEVGGNEVAYQHFPSDSGDTLLLIGGTTAWSGAWKNTAEDLRGDYDLYAMDLPPFGYSVPDKDHTYNLENQASLINGFVKNLKLRDVVLVAHSYGAGPSMEAVLQEQDQYKKFVIIDGAIHVDKKEGGPIAFLRGVFNIPTLRYFLTSAAVHFPGFIEGSLKYLVYDNSSVDDFWVDVYTRPLSVEDQSRRLGKWFSDFVFQNGTGLSSESKNYAALHIPVGILWGREDNLTPLKQGEYLHEIIPQSELIILDNVGHIPMIDDHARYIESLKEQLLR